jgi:hypothetical protein
MAVFVLFPTLPMLLVGAVAIGIPAIAFLSGNQTWLQSHTPDVYRGRVFGAFGMTNAFMLLVGTIFASTAGEEFGIVPSLGLVVLLDLVAGLAAFWLLRDALPIPVASNQPDTAQ